MSLGQVATRYAKSLLDLAIEQGKTDVVKGDMELFNEALKSRDLFLLLKSPIINPDKKVSALKAVFGDSLSELTRGFIDLSIKKGRESLLPEIAGEFGHQYNQYFKIATVKVTSAAPLDDQTTALIRQKIVTFVGGDKSIQMETVIDPALIGGFIIQYDDKLYDSSVVYQLNKLKQSFN